MIEICIADLIGVPFCDRGRDPKVGLDCWGLCRVIYERLGITLPMYHIGCFEPELISQVFESEKIALLTQVTNPSFPNFVAMKFNSSVVNHIGIYIGNKQFIHARQGSNVSIESVEHLYWKRAIQGYYEWSGKVDYSKDNNQSV